MNKALYLLGFLIVIAALGYGAMLLGVPMLWVGIGAAALIGIALIGAASHADSSDDVHHHHAS